MSNAPLTQAEIQGIAARAEGPTHLVHSDDCIVLLRAIAERDATIANLREDHDKLMCEITQLRRPSDAKGEPGSQWQPSAAEIAQIQERDRTVNWPVTSKHWLVETPYGQACLDRRLILHALAESQRDNARWLKARDCWQAEQKVWIDRAVKEQQRAEAAEKECAILRETVKVVQHNNRLNQEDHQAQIADLQQFHDWAEPQVQRLGREVVARWAAEVRAIQLANILANVAREWEESETGQIDGAFLDDEHKLLASPLPADTKEPPYYVRSFWSKPAREELVGPTGIEPVTSPMSTERSTSELGARERANHVAPDSKNPSK